jgi:molybdate transport system ATP-binding protein
MSAPLISLERVTLHSRDEALAEPLDWALGRGERWAILGSTASGKSQMAATLAGKTPPRSGTITYGLDGASAHPGTAIAYVSFDRRPSSPQLFHQARWHAALEVTSPKVSEHLAAAASDLRWERIASLLALDDLLDRRLHHLSDGEWRRVQIAEAFTTAPQLLILDDPFTGLDAHFRAALRELIAYLTEAETPILITASAPEEIPDCVTHVLVMAHGRAIAQGPKAVVLAGYRGEEAPDQRLLTPGVATTGKAVPPIVALHNVTIVHNGITVLRDINWTVHRGERWGLVGPNGAGKSTLLSLILGDHPQAYANRITLFGRPRGSGESIWEIKRRIGWVAPELHRYHPPLSSAIDVVCSGFFDTLGLHRGCSDQQMATASRWMAELGIQDVGPHPFRSLSKGIQRLALIARALVKEPELLIFDEPCQGLDDTQRARVLDTLNRVLASPEMAATLIYVTHRPHAFPERLTHLLELNRGRIARLARFDVP